jgi:hypothetical protein
MKKTSTRVLLTTTSALFMAFETLAQCGFTGLGPEYCPNSQTVILTPSNPGGLIVGPGGITGYTFNPAIAGPGIHTVTSYGGSCTGNYNITQGSYNNTFPRAGNAVSLGDDQVSGSNPIGFSFSFFCASYTDFYISSNGFITFSPSQPNGCCSGQFLPDGSTPNNLIAFNWTDCNPSQGGTITYTTIGTAPNRRLIVTFDDIPFYYNYPFFSVQTVLYESSNIIEIHTEYNDGSGGQTMGIEDQSGSTAFVVTGRNSSFWTVPNTTAEMVRFEPTYGCSYSQTVSVDAGAISVSGANTVCLNAPFQLVASGANTYTWNNSSNSPTLNATATGPMSFTVNGTGGGTLGCIYSSTAAITTVSVSLTTQVSHPLLCVGDVATLTANGATSYTWTGGQNTNTLTVTPVATTVYTVTAMNAAGCTHNFPVTVNVNSNTLTVSPAAVICAGRAATLMATGANSYTWSNGMQFSTFTVSPSSLTIYTVAGTDVNNCRIGGETTVTVNQPPAVLANATRPSICLGEAASLNASGASTYAWSTGKTGASIQETPTIDLPQYYVVTGTDAAGCSASLTVVVQVSRCTAIQETGAGLNTQVFPNPGTGRYTLRTSHVAPGNVVKVYNALGAMVKTIEMNGSELQIDLSREANGVYFMYLVSGGKTVSETKVIKE